MLFGLLGPLNWLVDLAWLSSDDHRQALRDKLANTYVVKLGAAVAGHGKLVFRQYDIGVYHFTFRELEPTSKLKPENSEEN